jgi:SAM-dependent methyltransferase
MVQRKDAPYVVKNKERLYIRCPFCGGKLVEKYSGLVDRLFTSKKLYAASECMTCHVGVLNPAPTGDVSRYYPTNYLSSEDNEENESKKFDLEKWYRYNQYDFDFGLLRRASGIDIGRAASYLDVGCGSGERVTYAYDRGCKQSFGVDKFDFAKSKSKQEVTLINADILAYKPEKKFQIVSLFHVLEHLEDPHEILEHLKAEVINKKGYLVIQVPNYGSLERRIFKNKWFSFDVPRHVWQFNESALTRLLDEAGYDIEAVYQVSAPLHPVTILPSMFRGMDVQRIWVDRTHGTSYKTMMKILWAGLTVLTIPLALIQNMFKRSSMLTVIASNK